MSSSSTNIGKKYNLHWQQIMLRIRDPKVTIPFYEKHFGMTLIDEYHFADWNFSIYFLVSLRQDQDASSLPKPGSKEAHKQLWTTNQTVLELTHNHGSENDEKFAVNTGNDEPYRGFGHIAFNLKDDLTKTCESLVAEGVKFQKLPHQGRMKNIAFALDPDGWWIEIVPRADSCTLTSKFNLSQCMIRVKNAKKACAFFEQVCNMSRVAELHFEQAKFSLFFYMSGLDDATKQALEKMDEAERVKFFKSQHDPVLELTHNWGTENDDDFHYHNGNTDPKGFGHIGFLVDNLDDCCKAMIEQGVAFQKKPSDGKMKSIAFALTPEDSYWVELIQRGAEF